MKAHPRTPERSRSAAGSEQPGCCAKRNLKFITGHLKHTLKPHRELSNPAPHPAFRTLVAFGACSHERGLQTPQGGSIQGSSNSFYICFTPTALSPTPVPAELKPTHCPSPGLMGAGGDTHVPQCPKVASVGLRLPFALMAQGPLPRDGVSWSPTRGGAALGPSAS